MRIPISTYRLQLHGGFPFVEAVKVVDYLDALGVTDLYSSPILQARPGSQHGYDVVDHSTISADLGGVEGFEALATALKAKNMGWVLDVVPNHMSVGDSSNRWWQDVLENGPSSPYSRYFDIEWNPIRGELTNKVLLPVLGDQYGHVLENGEIRLAYKDGSFFARYYDRVFPMASRTTTHILEPLLAKLKEKDGVDPSSVLELESIITALSYLPSRTETHPDRVRERMREKEVIRRRMARLMNEEPEAGQLLEEVLVQFNGKIGDPHSFDMIELLLADQAYRLSYWKVAAEEINYRRFFDVNELAALREEEVEVFDAAHEQVLRMLASGAVTGLRIDHPDGLYDPENYFALLQKRIDTRTEGTVTGADPWRFQTASCFVVAEKILTGNERLRSRWQVHGTVGYETANLFGGIFVDGGNAQAIRDIYCRFTGRREPLGEMSYNCKKLILKTSMSSELMMLARRLDGISEQHRWSRDFTFAGLHDALREGIASFPVYRTYVQAHQQLISEEDRRIILNSIRNAKRRNPSVNESIYDFIASVLLMEDPSGLNSEQVRERREFVMRFQQMTGPVTAKGIEDTLFYQYYPLASLNEVGGDPEKFGVSLEEFHLRNQDRIEHWPYTLTCSSTHDTKRSEDVRARIHVLSEIPDDWAAALEEWSAFNGPEKIEVEGLLVPDANEEYFIYQTLVGAWPSDRGGAASADFVARMEAYFDKAFKEAKTHTSWTNPNAERDEAVRRFLRRILLDSASNRFVRSMEAFQRRVAYLGMVNSLGMVTVKALAPGIPDFYQGCETWDFSLVDPDNRRPVDFDARRTMLAGLQAEAETDLASLPAALLGRWQSGEVKMWVTSRCLRLRQKNPLLFLEGDYLPLQVSGKERRRVCAFARHDHKQWCVVVVPRLITRMLNPRTPSLGDAEWGDTAVFVPEEAPLAWKSLFNSILREMDPITRKLEIGSLLKEFPVAVLTHMADPQ